MQRTFDGGGVRRYHATTARNGPEGVRLEKRRGHLRALAAEVPKIAAPVLGKRGFAEAQLVAQWPDIIGAELARQVTPEKLSFARGDRREGTLRLRVASGLALEVQHRAPLILERINAFFGYRAVARLALVQGPPLRSGPARPAGPRPLAAAEATALEARLAAVEDPNLRAALRRLGTTLLGTDGR